MAMGMGIGTGPMTKSCKKYQAVTDDARVSPVTAGGLRWPTLAQTPSRGGCPRDDLGNEWHAQPYVHA
eukprot:2307850-Pyramimonas_sp.AAC.1